MSVDQDIEDAARINAAFRLEVFRFIMWTLALAFLLKGLVLAWVRDYWCRSDARELLSG